MKNRTLILAGILSGSMMLTMGTTMTASAEEANTTLTVAAEEATENTENKENKESSDKASENAESKEAPGKTSENAESKEAPGKGMPPAFRLRDRSMQPPKENPQRNTDQQKSGNAGSENQSKTDESGKPSLILEKSALEALKKRCPQWEKAKIFVSLSHEKEYAAAQVIIEI